MDLTKIRSDVDWFVNIPCHNVALCHFVCHAIYSDSTRLFPWMVCIHNDDIDIYWLNTRKRCENNECRRPHKKPSPNFFATSDLQNSGNSLCECGWVGVLCCDLALVLWQITIPHNGRDQLRTPSNHHHSIVK